MDYIEEENLQKTKYEVEIDKEKLKVLREKIITNCSYITHVKCYEDEPLSKEYLEQHNIRNYKEEIRKKILEDKECYFLEYDIYKYSKLVEYVDKLLKGDLTVIKELREYKGENLTANKINIIKEYLNDIFNKKLQKPENLSKDEIENISNEIHMILLYIKMCYQENENQQSDEIYYADVMNCINLTKETSLKQEEYDKVYVMKYTEKKQ